MRHVASKLPSGSLDAAEAQAVTSTEGAAPPAEAGEKESKKSRRARQAAAEEDGEEAAGGGANEEERLEKLYDAVAWPLGKKYGHTYDAFKLALTCVSHTLDLYRITDSIPFYCSEPDPVFTSLPNPVPTSTKVLLMQTIARRLTPQPIKLRADIELTCYMPAGIDAIKKSAPCG